MWLTNSHHWDFQARHWHLIAFQRWHTKIKFVNRQCQGFIVLKEELMVLKYVTTLESATHEKQKCKWVTHWQYIYIYFPLRCQWLLFLFKCWSRFLQTVFLFLYSQFAAIYNQQISFTSAVHFALSKLQAFKRRNVSIAKRVWHDKAVCSADGSG